MDWAKFELAMTDPRFVHETAVIRDEPRMPVHAVLDNLDDGMSLEEIASAYQIDVELFAAVKQFVESQRLAHSIR